MIIAQFKATFKNICMEDQIGERHRQRPKDLAHQRGFPPWQGIFPLSHRQRPCQSHRLNSPRQGRLDCGKPIYQVPPKIQQDLPGKAGGEIRPVPVDR